MSFAPFQIRIELNTGITVGHYAPALDGLLSKVLHRHYGGDIERAIEGLSDYLLMNDSGYYHASTLSFGVNADTGLFGTEFNTVRSLKGERDLHPSLFKPHGKGGKYPRIIQDGGPTAPRLQKHLAYHAPLVCFEGYGNGHEIAELFRFYLLSIGSNGGPGAGDIGHIHVMEQEQDHSVVDAQNKLARVIPQADYKTLFNEDPAPEMLDQGRLIPPYWQKEALCKTVRPETIRRQIIV
ncbi:hypothetical protein [Neptuniibacter sp. QD37_11]|uniref:hypothetical protein n=1 Tax=Neptuniibacter sp. QD37_11 TaxID=3398209 RepID=UPI0039F62D81